jgi:hypothetical protein
MQGTRRARAATGAGRGAQGDAAPSSPIGSGQLARLGLRASLAALSVRLWYLQAVTIGHQESNKHEARCSAELAVTVAWDYCSR